jgi:hypothetical protein
MVVNDNAFGLDKRGALESIASSSRECVKNLFVRGRMLSAHPLVRGGGGQHGRLRTCRSSPRHKINFDIIGALVEYSYIARDQVECDNKYKQPLPFGDSAMNTGSRRTLLIATAQASHGHNGNNWIVAQAN